VIIEIGVAMSEEIPKRGDKFDARLGEMRSVMDTEEMKTKIDFLEAENQRLKDKIIKLETAIKQFAEAIGEKI
jgi:hypothetical protein